MGWQRHWDEPRRLSARGVAGGSRRLKPESLPRAIMRGGLAQERCRPAPRSRHEYGPSGRLRDSHATTPLGACLSLPRACEGSPFRRVCSPPLGQGVGDPVRVSVRTAGLQVLPRLPKRTRLWLRYTRDLRKE